MFLSACTNLAHHPVLLDIRTLNPLAWFLMQILGWNNWISGRCISITLLSACTSTFLSMPGILYQDLPYLRATAFLSYQLVTMRLITSVFRRDEIKFHLLSWWFLCTTRAASDFSLFRFGMGAGAEPGSTDISSGLSSVLCPARCKFWADRPTVWHHADQIAIARRPGNSTSRVWSRSSCSLPGLKVDAGANLDAPRRIPGEHQQLAWSPADGSLGQCSRTWYYDPFHLRWHSDSVFVPWYRSGMPAASNLCACNVALPSSSRICK